MSKIVTIFFTFILLTPLWGGEQLVVVVSADMNSTTGIMQRYEKYIYWKKIGEPVSVTLGRSGLGWADGGTPLKNEGDGRSPAGLFGITRTFGYDEHPNSALAYLHADQKLICIDDVNATDYNKLSFLDPLNPPGSYETMRRDDEVYRNGVIIDYNTAGNKGRGSCIFIHLNHPDNHPTSGCTAMDESSLRELLSWFDPQKNPQILQIPKSECGKYKDEFRGIECE